MIGTLCGKATFWALPGYTYRLYCLVEGIWKPSGLLCLFRTGLSKAEEISLCSTNIPRSRISASAEARIEFSRGNLDSVSRAVGARATGVHAEA